MPLACRLDECDLVDFFERRKSMPHAVERRFAQELHAFLRRQLADLGAGLLLQNHFTDRISQVKQFVDGGSSAIAGAAALNAARTFLEVEVAPLSEFEAAGNQHFVIVTHGAYTVFADSTHQALRQNAIERGDEVVRL